MADIRLTGYHSLSLNVVLGNFFRRLSSVLSFHFQCVRVITAFFGSRMKGRHSKLRAIKAITNLRGCCKKLSNVAQAQLRILEIISPCHFLFKLELLINFDIWITPSLRIKQLQLTQFLPWTFNQLDQRSPNYATFAFSRSLKKAVVCFTSQDLINI